jgi:hypothetical protein
MENIRVGSVVQARGGVLYYIVESISGNELVGCRQSNADGSELMDSPPTTYRADELTVVVPVKPEDHKE